MNYNIIAYLIFLSLMIFIIFRIGKICYRNGNIFVATLLPGHIELCQRINKLLLIGYYLINIGYCAVTIANWQTILSIQILIEVLTYKAAIILFMLAVLHYANLFIIKNYVQKLIQ
ncbi:hypothetical protein [Flavobacterium cerinum]|uniref:Uncharacterized protein n=1 Tax=Flavobacterium cerinum TaxID=2502784 RepID=A0ABY5IVS2_9FLAO|nr:hypothetical protein [Flavobacterium cerinum]UUC46929.1 hypothetical protein NOX80_06945 [Flavobacterium cerinum]